MSVNKREETVMKYLSEYLEGKGEEKSNEFLSRPLDKQYAAIMAWKYRKDEKKGAKRKGKTNVPQGLTSAEVIKHIQSLPTLIDMIENLPDSDFDVMYAGLDAAREALRNYHANRRAREIAALEKERDEIQRRIDALRQ